MVETLHKRVMIGWPMCQAVPSLFVFSLPLSDDRMANVSSSAEFLCFLITITSPHTTSSYHWDVLWSRRLQNCYRAYVSPLIFTKYTYIILAKFKCSLQKCYRAYVFPLLFTQYTSIMYPHLQTSTLFPLPNTHYLFPIPSSLFYPIPSICKCSAF